MLSRLSAFIKKLTYPIPFRRADWALYGILADQKDKHISSKTILDMEYGPGFLEKFGVESLPPYDIQVKNIFQDREVGPLSKLFLSTVTLGYIQGKPAYTLSGTETDYDTLDDDATSVFLNRAYFNPLAQVLMLGFLKGFGLSVISAARRGIAATVQLLDKNAFLAMDVLASIRHAVITQLVTMPFRSMLSILGHEHIHVLQKCDPDTAETGLNMLDNHFKDTSKILMNRLVKSIYRTESLVTLGVTPYLLNDYEIQARLHTLFVNASKRWGTLPRTREQLWTGLSDIGLAMPADIRADLKNKLKGDFSAVAGFKSDGLSAGLARFGRKALSTDLTEIMAVQNSLYQPSLKNLFWRETLPFMYGHLLQLYGKSDGLGMMGITLTEDDRFHITDDNGTDTPDSPPSTHVMVFDQDDLFLPQP